MACALFYSPLPPFRSVRFPPGLFCQGCARSVPQPDPPPPIGTFVANKGQTQIRPSGHRAVGPSFLPLFGAESRCFFTALRRPLLLACCQRSVTAHTLGRSQA